MENATVEREYPAMHDTLHVVVSIVRRETKRRAFTTTPVTSFVRESLAWEEASRLERQACGMAAFTVEKVRV